MGGSDESTTRPQRPQSARRHAPLLKAGDLLLETYEVLDTIGTGGMGQVVEARDRLLDRRVAIKVAWPGNEEALRKEARILAALRHPSMVAVHHITKHGALELVVMERVYGVPLSEHMIRRQRAGERFSIAEALDTLVGIAEGLAVVHRAGVAHRDVKPSNVMLAPGNRVVLMDFGLSLPEIDPSFDGPAGTPRYMAPEAILDDALLGSRHRVDLYAFGVLAFEVLTLHTPFPGDRAADIWSKHLSSDAPDPRTLRAEVPPRLAALVRSLMAKSPSERPDGIETVLLELAALRRGPSDVGKGFSVLIVDDDADMAALLRALVRKTCPTALVATAHDADAAIRHLHQRTPDLLLLDLRMPTMNGVELAMYLRGTQLCEATQIVAVSALAAADDRALLRLLGITDFVAKGPDLEARLGPLLALAERRRNGLER